MSSYARSGYRKSAGSYRRGYATAIRRNYTPIKKMSTSRTGAGVKRPKFALAGYRKDTEKKYFDKSINSASATLTTSIAPATGFISSAGAASGVWGYGNQPGTTPLTTTNTYIQDFLKGLPQGPNSTSRIGNVIHVKYLKGNITLAANYITNATTGYENSMYGEAVVDDVANTLIQYLRTTYRVCIVRDLQVNSTATQVNWGDVFSNLDGTAGVHSELNIANMGRFRILMDKLVHLDADDPQKTIPFLLKGIGNVRYNGPQDPGAGSALTDTGIYVIWANLSAGIGQAPVAAATMRSSNVIVNSRICFTDA